MFVSKWKRICLIQSTRIFHQQQPKQLYRFVYFSSPFLFHSLSPSNGAACVKHVRAKVRTQQTLVNIQLCFHLTRSSIAIDA